FDIRGVDPTFAGIQQLRDLTIAVHMMNHSIPGGHQVAAIADGYDTIRVFDSLRLSANGLRRRIDHIQCTGIPPGHKESVTISQYSIRAFEVLRPHVHFTSGNLYNEPNV